jgi:hypothetical protein
VIRPEICRSRNRKYYGDGHERRQPAAQVNRFSTGETAHPESQEADDQHRVLEIREDSDLGSDPPDQHHLKQQADNTHEKIDSDNCQGLAIRDVVEELED